LSCDLVREQGELCILASIWLGKTFQIHQSCQKLIQYKRFFIEVLNAKNFFKCPLKFPPSGKIDISSFSKTDCWWQFRTNMGFLPGSFGFEMETYEDKTFEIFDEQWEKLKKSLIIPAP